MTPLRLPLGSLVRLSLACALALAAFALSAHAQLTVRVVDKANGAGTDFTKLEDAIAASSDGDLLLIRAGYYGAQVVDGMGLVLQAEAGADVRLGSIVVQNVGAAQRFAMRGIDFVADETIPLRLANNAGPVWIEDAEYFAGFAPVSTALDADDCDALVLRDVVLHGGTFYEPSSYPPCAIVTNSTAAIYSSDLTGGDGNYVGQTGLVVYDSLVTLYGTFVRGGVGHGGFPDAGAGGTGMVLTGTLGTTAVERVKGGVVGGVGAPGYGGTPGSTGPSTERTGTGGTYTALLHKAHTYSSPSPIRSGDPTTLTFTGEPGDLVWVAVATDPALLTATVKGIGPLVLPMGAQLIPFGSLPTTGTPGTLVVDVNAPALLGTFSFYTQGIFLGPKNSPLAIAPHISLGTPSQIHVLDASL